MPRAADRRGMVLLACFAVSVVASCTSTPGTDRSALVPSSRVATPVETAQPTPSQTLSPGVHQPVPAQGRRPAPTNGACGTAGADFNGDGFSDLAITMV